jgi:hypothetical protein
MTTNKTRKLLPRLIAVGILAVVASTIGGVTGNYSASAAHCSAWALADQYDRRTDVYAAGGGECRSREPGLLVHVSLFRDGRWLMTVDNNCNHAYRCGVGTGPVSNPPGDQQWCARTGFVHAGFGGETLKWHCMHS